MLVAVRGDILTTSIIRIPSCYGINAEAGVLSLGAEFAAGYFMAWFQTSSPNCRGLSCCSMAFCYVWAAATDFDT